MERDLGDRESAAQRAADPAKAPTLRERLVPVDGALQDGDIRYLLIRADSLMQLFRKLEPGTRAQAFQAFATSLEENGRKSIETRMRRNNLDSERLYDDLARNSGSQLGWGVWSFTRTHRERFAVDVANSPFAAGYGPSDEPVCFAIRGMLSAMGELVMGKAVAVTETKCAAVSGGSCRFEVEATRIGKSDAS